MYFTCEKRISAISPHPFLVSKLLQNFPKVIDCKTVPFFALGNRASAKGTRGVWGEQASHNRLVMEEWGEQRLCDARFPQTSRVHLALAQLSRPKRLFYRLPKIWLQKYLSKIFLKQVGNIMPNPFISTLDQGQSPFKLLAVIGRTVWRN